MSFGDQLGAMFGEFQQKHHVGTVVEVDTTNYRLNAILDNYEERGVAVINIPWLSPLGHPDGTGIHAMYRPGTRILVLEYAYCEFIVLGSIAVPDGATDKFTNVRKRMNQGDHYLAVSEQTYIMLNRPEFITISGNHACQLRFDGTNNVIYTRAQRYQVQADGGEIGWESDPDTDETVLSWILRDKADPNSNVVHVRAGFHKVEDQEAQTAQIDKSVFSIIVKKVALQGEDDEVTEDVQFKLIIGENGRILCSANSIKEVYRDFIDRYAETTITDVAKSTIQTTSMEDSIYENAAATIINTAPLINHKG